MDAVTSAPPTLKQAFAAVAETAVEQARDLAVSQLDDWAARVRHRLAIPVDHPATEDTTPGLVKPLVVGALAGAALAWLLAGRRPEA